MAIHHPSVFGQIVKGTTVRAVCTDNASVMRKTWQILRSRIPGIVTYGCACHVLQLLGSDASKLPEVNETISHATMISTNFRTHLRKSGLAALRIAQASSLGKERTIALPCKTRWSSTLACIDSLVKSRQALVIVVSEESWSEAKLNAL